MSILLQRNGVMEQGFAGLDGVAVTFALSGLLCVPIHPAVSFPVHIKGCYVTLLGQFGHVSAHAVNFAAT